MIMTENRFLYKKKNFLSLKRRYTYNSIDYIKPEIEYKKGFRLLGHNPPLKKLINAMFGDMMKKKTNLSIEKAVTFSFLKSHYLYINEDKDQNSSTESQSLSHRTYSDLDLDKSIEVIDSGCYNKQLFHPSIEENLFLDSIEESGMSFSIDDYQIIYKIFKQKNNNRNYPRISFDDYTNFIK